MNKFIDYLKNGTLTESDKNWKAIAQKFDTIEKVEILKDDKTINVTGKKSNKASEEEVEYKNAAVAKEVKNKLLYLIGIKEDDNLDEAAVGQKGRTSYKEAMDYCEENEELVAEFRKIVKKLGGKTVAKALLDKLSQKPEIKDEIDNIEDIVDNSNY